MTGRAETEPVREAFNRTGDRIDDLARRNPIIAWMRSRSREELARWIAPGDRLLEIGCGTGVDAVYWAGREHGVVACDVSDQMVVLARARSRQEGTDRRLRLLCGNVPTLAAEIEASGEAPFHVAYANFSLTYEPDLKGLASTVHRLLAPAGVFLFSLPNRLAVSDLLLAIGRGRWRRSRGRFARIATRWLAGVPVAVRAYTPMEVRAATRAWFTLEKLVGLPVFQPPPGLYRDGPATWLGPLRGLDNRLGARFPWVLLGDHILYVARRAPGKS